MPDSMTQVLSSGPPGTKVNIAVLGDGFTAADQATYDAKVQSLLLDGVFGNDYYYEDKQGFNIYRVNLMSNHSGVSQRKYDNGTLLSTTLYDTALGIIFNGSWSHCWLEWGANSSTLINNALNTWVPDHQLVLIILNDPNYGGCGGGGFATVPMGVGWQVIAHEFGHGYGGFGDEYCGNGAYSGGEPGVPNDTINTNRATLKWGRFVAPSTPVPTGTGSCSGYNVGAKPAGWDDNQDVGLFEGGATKDTGVYRPVINCRMNSNTPPYCPVCYTVVKTKTDPKAQRTFLRAYAGDFNGDKKDDLLVHNGNAIQIYRSSGSQLDIVFSMVEMIPGSWQFRTQDQFYIGDFNGDGKDEAAVFNGNDWSIPYLGLLADDGNNGLKLIARYDNSMPGWQFRPGDRFYVADFDGDGLKDLFVFNGHDWSIPYVGMLHSTGTSFSLVKRFDSVMPDWQMKPGDQHFVGDFSGDKKEDLWVFNGSDWSIPYLGMLASSGADLAMSKRYDALLPDWQMTPGDQCFVGDFDGDGRADLYIFNGSNWSIAYLGMLRSTGSELQMAQRYDGNVPGWQMRKNDSHWTCDINGDGKTDLFVYNWQDWSTQYLGTMRSSGAALNAQWTADWVGEWNLGAVDQFAPCNYEGVAGKRDHLRAQHRLVRDDQGAAWSVVAEDLLPVDPQLPLRPQLVRTKS